MEGGGEAVTDRKGEVFSFDSDQAHVGGVRTERDKGRRRGPPIGLKQMNRMLAGVRWSCEDRFGFHVAI